MTRTRVEGLQVGQHVIDQQQHALAPDPGPNPLYPHSQLAGILGLPMGSPHLCQIKTQASARGAGAVGLGGSEGGPGGGASGRAGRRAGGLAVFGDPLRAESALAGAQQRGAGSAVAGGDLAAGRSPAARTVDLPGSERSRRPDRRCADRPRCGVDKSGRGRRVG